MWNHYILSSIVVLVITIFYQYYSLKGKSVIDYPESCYDYIIGTAGCVVSSRLSEIKNSTILLIEAGSYFNYWLSSVPFLAPFMQLSKVDWAYKTETQSFSSKGFYDRKQSVPRGKGLGGSGQLNYLVHSFGIAEDYREWPKGWSYEELLPYMNKVLEKMSLTTTFETEPEEYLANAFMNSDKSNNRVFRSIYTTKNGQRWSTFHAYLQPALNRNNFHILLDTIVGKVLIKNSKAYGIEIKLENGSRKRIQVKKEIILCAGAVNTPQLLMLSGIGNASLLNAFQIPVTKDIPDVGKNLYDNLFAPIYVNLNAPVSLTLNKISSFVELYKYFVHGTGLLATNGIKGIGRDFFNVSEIMLFGIGTADERLLIPISNLKTEIFRSMFPSWNDTSHEGFIYLATCLKPKSRGTITLNSSDIMVPPKIDPAYLDIRDDVFCTHKAILLALKSLESELFQRFGAKVHLPDLEECRQFSQDYKNIHYAECVIRIAGITSHHLGGTCRMGKDDRAVVDENLRVKGVKGLRIIDSSVIPTPISGTPNSILIAMAEKISDLLI